MASQDMVNIVSTQAITWVKDGLLSITRIGTKTGEIQ